MKPEAVVEDLGEFKTGDRSSSRLDAFSMVDGIVLARRRIRATTTKPLLFGELGLVGLGERLDAELVAGGLASERNR